MLKATLSRDIKIIKCEIDKYNRKERNSVFEIGKRFKHVKENILKHGQYTKWIKEIGYTPGTAQKYVRVYERFGNMEEVSNIRVSTLFEMLSLNKLINIKDFVGNVHNVNGELKKVEQMKKRELRDLVKATNASITSEPVKASPATRENKQSSNFEAVFLKKMRSSNPEDKELMEIILEYLDWELQRVLDLSPEQKTELLSCCKDNSYSQDLSKILNLLEKGLDHIKIKDHFVPTTKQAE